MSPTTAAAAAGGVASNAAADVEDDGVAAAPPNGVMGAANAPLAPAAAAVVYMDRHVRNAAGLAAALEELAVNLTAATTATASAVLRGRIFLAPGIYDLSILDCGDAGGGALVMGRGGFVLRDLMFTRCGGPAPVLVNFTVAGAEGSSGSGSSIAPAAGSNSMVKGGWLEGCVFEANAGFVAGAVAVQPGAESEAQLHLSGCVFRNNTGTEQPGDYTYDYIRISALPSKCNYIEGVVPRPVMPASVLALGRGQHRISGCVFEDNAPPPGTSLNQSQVSTVIDLGCWQGPAALVIEDSVFYGNAGRQSGAVYVHGHTDGVTPSLGCRLTLRRVEVARNAGYQAGAILASCPVKGSNCELSLTDTAVTDNTTPQSGTILVRGSGLVLSADNLTLSRNSGGGLGYVDTGITLANSRVEGNSGPGYGGVSGWGGFLAAVNTSFSRNAPTKPSFDKAAANLITNSYGGHALYVYAADISIRASRFLRNTFLPGAYNTHGGALMLFDLVARSVITSTLFERNAAVVGGAVRVYVSQALSVSDCVFKNNYALSGAGMEIEVPFSTVSIANSSFVNNTACGTAEELRAAAGITNTVLLENVTLAGNSALVGGGIYVSSGGRCKDAAGCYPLRLDARVLITGNRAEMAGDPSAAAPPPQLFESGGALPVAVQIFDFYGQKVARSFIDSAVLILCTSLNALGQKAAQAVAGTADFSQLRLRDQLGSVGLSVALRPCRINEELSAEGDVCSPCGQDFYSLGGGPGHCLQCPEGAACSHRGLGGVPLVPLDGYWHSGPLSANVIACPNEAACRYGGRMEALAASQQSQLRLGASSGSGSGTPAATTAAAGPAPPQRRRRHLVSEAPAAAGAAGVDASGGQLTATSNTSVAAGAAAAAAAAADDEYRQLQCADGYWGNVCGSCKEGYGHVASGRCRRCRSLGARVGWIILAYGITMISIIATIRAALTPEYVQLAAAAAEAQRSFGALFTYGARKFSFSDLPPIAPDQCSPGGGAAATTASLARRFASRRAVSFAGSTTRSEMYGTFGGRTWKRRTDVISEHQTVVKILFSYLQVLSLVKNTPISWPSVMINYFNVASQASSAASSLASLDCSMSTASGLPKSAQLFLIQVLAPAFWYPSVTGQLFGLFSCIQLDTGPAEKVCPEPWDEASCRWDRHSVGLFWTQDPEQRCYEGVHLTLCAAVGVPGVLLFAAGIPLLSAWWLWRNRRRLWEDSFLSLYGSLYQEYEDGFYFWESVVMLRKLAVTAVIVFAGTYRWQLTLLISMGVIALSLLLQVAYRPYESDAMDELERLGLVATLVTFYLATYFMDDQVNRGVQVGLSLAILVINAITLFIMVVAIIRELHRAALFRLLRLSPAQQQGQIPLLLVVQDRRNTTHADMWFSP
eukprot:XP_001693669.1 predicted protein [Chlamydomonas reinhardtii]